MSLARQLFFLYYFTRFREENFITLVRICFSRESNISVCFAEGVLDVLASLDIFSRHTESYGDESTWRLKGRKISR